MKSLRRVMLAVLTLSLFVAAQPPKMPAPKDVATIFDRSVSNAEQEIVSLAEAMPDSTFNYKPTAGEFKDVRTLGEQFRHVATANYEFGSMMLGEKSPVAGGDKENGPDLKTKAEIVKQLKDSFAYLHRATTTLTTANATEQVGTDPFRPTRLGLAMLAVSHVMDHYGQCVEYARSNNVVPPASRQ